MTPLEALVDRLYTPTSSGPQYGFQASDFDPYLLKDGISIVVPLFPPEQLSSGIALPPQIVNLPGTGAYVYRVIAMALEQPHEAPPIEIGDVVLLRNAHLDPIQVDRKVFTIKTEHILAVIHRPEKEQETPDEVGNEANG